MIFNLITIYLGWFKPLTATKQACLAHGHVYLLQPRQLRRYNRKALNKTEMADVMIHGALGYAMLPLDSRCFVGDQLL
jgi:hypothetical protein